MSVTWNDHTPPPQAQIGPLGWVRVVIRGIIIGALVFGGYAILLLLRLAERPVFGTHRPLTPKITKHVCRLVVPLMGLRLRRIGTPMSEHGASVANHSSWLDIFVLNASDQIYFVSKSEVARWPGIGWLAQGTGTVFIARDRKQAKAQAHTLQSRLADGHRLLFFPEGTSTDGQRVLPFKTPLFAALIGVDTDANTYVQPVSIVYHAPAHLDHRFYGWWGDMDFAAHLITVLAHSRSGRVDVVYHPPHRVADFPDRKRLAAACEQDVRNSHAERLAIQNKAE